MFAILNQSSKKAEVKTNSRRLKRNYLSSLGGNILFVYLCVLLNKLYYLSMNHLFFCLRRSNWFFSLFIEVRLDINYYIDAL